MVSLSVGTKTLRFDGTIVGIMYYGAIYGSARGVLIQVSIKRNANAFSLNAFIDVRRCHEMIFRQNPKGVLSLCDDRRRCRRR